MKFNIEALPAEDIEPLAKAMANLPPERRGEVYFRIQNAAREFLAKADAGTPLTAAGQTDPIRKAVFGALEKQLPAPAPTLDPLKREALGTLEKAVLAGARAALGSAMRGARGVGDALGVTGRAGAMRQMRAGYKSFHGMAIRHAKGQAERNAERAYSATAGKGVDTTGRAAAAAQAAHRETMAGGRANARVKARLGADLARAKFKLNRAGTLASAGVGAFGAGATYADTRPRRKKDQ